MKRQFFLALLMGVAVLFAACRLDEKQEANVDPEVGGETYTIRFDFKYPENAEGLYAEQGRASTSVPSATPGTSVTLTVVPPTPKTVETPEGGGGGIPDTVVTWSVVAPITGVYGKESTKFSKFNATGGNSWTFPMPTGDLTIKIAFTNDAPAPDNANLAWLESGEGEIDPPFNSNTQDYQLLVPYDTTIFSVYAQAENTTLSPPFMQKTGTDGGNTLLGRDLTLGEGGPFAGESAGYTITVTAEDETTKKYNITVIRLPDLSLEPFKIVREGSDFARDLLPIDTQTVYIPYTDGFNIIAVPKVVDEDTTVDINPKPENISGVNAINSTKVNVTVSHDITGVNKKYTEKDYTVNLLYNSAVALEPLAEGGYVSFIPAETEGAYYEVHTFLESGTLSFLNEDAGNRQADIFLVAGGGASGGDGNNEPSVDGAGGGGAGGLLYTSASIETVVPTQVYVGKGGIGGGLKAQGNDGEASWIGTSDSERSLTAPGGGGGGAGGGGLTGAVLNGMPGGSGGGGGSGHMRNFGTGGEKQDAPGSGNVLGNSGGNGNGSGQTGITDAGGGGGGAGGKGGDASGSNYGIPGDGGDGWNPYGETAWIFTVTGVSEFSHGGRGGGNNLASEDGKNFGDGGSGGSLTGGKGHDGIVIIRFPRSETPPEEEPSNP